MCSSDLLCQRLFHDGREFGVGQYELGAAVIENEGDGGGVEPDVDRVVGRASCRERV